MTYLKAIARSATYLRPFIFPFVVSIVFSVFAWGLFLFISILIRGYVDVACLGGLNDKINIVTTIAAILICIFYLMVFISSYLRKYIKEEVVWGLKLGIFSHLQKLPLSFHVKKGAAGVLSYITKDVSSAADITVDIIPSIFIYLIYSIATSVIIFFAERDLLFIIFLLLGVHILDVFISVKDTETGSLVTDQADRHLAAMLMEKRENQRTIRALGEERRDLISFGVIARRSIRSIFNNSVYADFAWLRFSILYVAWGVIFVWHLVVSVAAQRITIGSAIMLCMLFWMLGRSLSQLVKMLVAMPSRLGGVFRLHDLLSIPIQDVEDPKSKGEVLDGNISLKGVSLALEDDKDVMKSVDINFPAFSVSAVMCEDEKVGDAIVNMLLKFTSPTSGIVSVDGHNITEIRHGELKRKFGLVSSQEAIFDGTVMDNILYGNESKERGDAMSAARFCNAHDFIMKLPGGYDAPVGPSGVLLTPGQRELITLARVALRDPQVVIYNEPSIPTDQESMGYVHDCLIQFARTKTVIVVAKNIETAKRADRIFFFENGVCVEEGGFDELLGRKGKFFRYYWRRFSGKEPFKRHLEIEIERSRRYGSKFCLMALGVGDEDIFALYNMFREQIRIGDDVVVWGDDRLIILLPEIDAEQMKKFWSRIVDVIKTKTPVDSEYLSVVGVCIEKSAQVGALDMINKVLKKRCAIGELMIIDEGELGDL